VSVKMRKEPISFERSAIQVLQDIDVLTF